jgi:CDP-glucose 4,6-dehydratase
LRVPAAWTVDAKFWKHRRVAVTGGTGFLGSHLVGLLLDAGAEVVVLVRDDVAPTGVVERWKGRASLVHGQVEDLYVVERMLGEYGVATVMHLAAQSQVEVANRNPLSTLSANVAGTWTVLEAARRSPAVGQVVLASSDKAYGEQPVLPYTEDMELRAVNPYDVSKACADLLGRSYALTMGVPAVITRCGNFFGPGDTNWDRLVPGIVRSVLEGVRPVIRSDGTLTRDYLFVVDGALSYMRLAEAIAADAALAGEAFNFSTEKPLTVLELVALIQAAAGTVLEPDVRATARNEISHQALSAQKARSVLGWEPRYTVEEALAETVAWYRAELDLTPR